MPSWAQVLLTVVGVVLVVAGAAWWAWPAGVVAAGAALCAVGLLAPDRGAGE